MTIELTKSELLNFMRTLEEVKDVLRGHLHNEQPPTSPPPHPPQTMKEWVTDWITTHVPRINRRTRARVVGDELIGTLEHLNTLTNSNPSHALTVLLQQFPKENVDTYPQWLAFTNAIRHYIDNLALLSKQENLPRLHAMFNDIAEGLFAVRD